MFKTLLFSPKLYFFGAALIALPVVAQAPTPSQEFWDYIAEYGDDNGDVLDPLEYDQILGMKEGEGAHDIDVVNKSSSADNPHARHADMKIEQTSSAQASSSAMKGARL